MTVLFECIYSILKIQMIFEFKKNYTQLYEYESSFVIGLDICR
jgi:hypothetical protein